MIGVVDGVSLVGVGEGTIALIRARWKLDTSLIATRRLAKILSWGKQVYIVLKSNVLGFLWMKSALLRLIS